MDEIIITEEEEGDCQAKKERGAGVEGQWSDEKE